MARSNNLANHTNEFIGPYERGVSLRECGVREHVVRLEMDK